jgi:RNA polymerase sigma-70 factor (ECF subfamily)
VAPAREANRPALIDGEQARIAAAQQDPRAFAPLYEAYADLVWRFALRRLGDPERASDVTSLTFTRALAALQSFRPRAAPADSGFRAWLMTIARNVVTDEVRGRRPVMSLTEPAWRDRVPDHRPSPEIQAIAADERRRMTAAIGQLPETQRRIVELRLAGHTAAEIGSQLQMSVSAVNTAHFRAMGRLRDLLATDGEHLR